MKKKKIIWTVIIPSSIFIFASDVMSNVPTPFERYKASIPTNIKALPMKVKRRNFIAEYSFLPLPQIEIKKYIGISSNSQNKKNRNISNEVKTPIIEVCNIKSHIKYSLTLNLIFHDAITAQNPNNPVSNTIGALKPSTPK